MVEDKTAPRTLWTETLLDMLVSAAERGRENETREILRDIRRKGYPKKFVVKYVATRLDSDKTRALVKTIETMPRGRKRAS